jgi:integrase
MPTKHLTEAAVERIQPPANGKQIDYYDTGMPRLILRVNYGGAKVWRALHYIKKLDTDGKRLTIPTTFKLGRYPHLKLKEAREKARAFLADPEKALTQADAGTFKDVAQNFLKRHVEANKLRSKGEIERCLTVYVYPAWGKRGFREIKRRDVANLLDVIEDNHGKRQADVVLSIIRKLMNWHVTRDDDYVSPVVRGMKRATGNGGRERILAEDEIRALWNACGGMGTYGALLKLLLLTAQREGKVAEMRWTDIVDGVWTIPTEEREKGNAGKIKLPPLALDILAAQPQIAGNPFVFAGSPRGRRSPRPAAFCGFSEAKRQLDAKLPLPHWTLHDLRRTARSLMSKAGVRPDIAERVLGHAIQGVEGIYDRHSYAEEKADALKRLARQVATIVNPPADNVVAAQGRFSGSAGGRKRRAAG